MDAHVCVGEITTDQKPEKLTDPGGHKTGLSGIDFKNLKCTRHDFYLITCLVLINFGDGVELYLPGVFTQTASTELNITKNQEDVMGIVMYISLTLTIVFVTPFLKQ